MTPVRVMRCWLSWLAACALALGGCASTVPAPPQLPPCGAGTIGRLSVDGSNAFVNGRQASGGQCVFDGDTVSTGERTSAMLILNQGGGYVQLDQHTDPLFKQGACMLMKILRGRVLFSNMRCQEFEDGFRMAGAAGSLVHIESAERESQVTVIDGRVDMRSPRAATLFRYGEYVATSAGEVQVRQLAPAEAAARIAWTQNYFRQPARAEPGKRSVARTAAAVGIVAAVAVIICRATGSCGRAKREPEPQPQPQRNLPNSEENIGPNQQNR